MMVRKKPDHGKEIKSKDSKKVKEVENEFGIVPVKPDFHIMPNFKDNYSVEIMKQKHKNAVIR